MENQNLTNKEMAECINEGVVKKEYVKNIIHFVCRASMREAKLNKQPNNIIAGLKIVELHLIQFSGSHTYDGGIKAVTYADNLLEYCFNQKNSIPTYVYHWLRLFYKDIFVDPAKYTERHYDIYYVLQHEYVQHYRAYKQDEKYCNIIYPKQCRRQIRKMYRSGKYTTAFNLYNMPLLDIIPKGQIDDIALLMSQLFAKEFDTVCDDAHTAAIGYIVGRLQGLSEAKKTA